MGDYPYILLILLLAICAYLEGVHKRKDFYIASLWIVFFFMAFRAPTVGADTIAYYKFFTGERVYYSATDTRELETLFLVYNNVLAFFLARNGLLYMIVNTFLSLILVKILIDRYSSYKSLSVLLFFLIFDYLIYFIALRQILGYSLLLLGIIYVYEKKKYRWLVYMSCSLVGYFFHTSIIFYAVIIGALYFVPINKFFYICIVGLSFFVGFKLKSYDLTTVFGLYLDSQVEATDRLDNYMQNDTWLSDNKIVFQYVIRPSLWAALIVLFLDKQKINNWFVKIHLFSICLFNLLNSFSMLPRLNAGFSIFGIIVLSWVFPIEIVFNERRLIRQWLLVAFIVFFMRSYILKNIEYDRQGEDEMHPYKTILSY